MNYAIILAGGVGSRVGAGRPKQFVEILEKPVLAYTMQLYQNFHEIDAIEVVCHEQWIDYLKDTIQKENLTKVKWIVPGGEDFQQSVMNGVNNLQGKISKDDIVMIHYGAAPFTSEKILFDALEVCKQHGMSVSCTPCFQLMGSKDYDIESKTWIDRDKQVQIACPQCFRYGYLLDIYKEAEEKGLIGKVEPHTTSIMYALGKTLYLSYGDQTNIKITTSEDLDLFEGWVLMKKNKLCNGKDKR